MIPKHEICTHVEAFRETSTGLKFAVFAILLKDGLAKKFLWGEKKTLSMIEEKNIYKQVDGKEFK